ncbi:hypothetical protein BOH71_18970, partial [Bacillus subtilis]
ITVGKEMGRDMTTNALEIRDDAGCEGAKVIASSEFGEHAMLSIKAKGARFDVWGVGTKPITA